ncbi:hypothetical protein BJY14_003388 [Actinomadura luteofluorescens]|uniref:Uncharacterized protein n=1 Tax=Actinomadura luteofluorescens TaxID=46163 RepID=A0A7Y9EHF8_9ACTN|nr:hypothetical protein [Actinomadura luteofluorescens]NYD47405.1 hypothetical protein [Actinomadura luteofluorescens]
MPAPADLAAAGPKGAKKMLTKAADPLPAAELAPFFEQALPGTGAGGRE